MEQQYQAAQNGVSFQTTDANNIGLTAAVADDRTLDELFRFIPFNGTQPGKYILPSGYAGAGAGASAASGTNQPTVVPATGSVNVFPFRAIIASQTLVATSGLENYRGARSGIAVGAAALAQNVTFANNASGNPRWDLVYAAVNVAAVVPSATRFVKSPTTGAISSVSVNPGIQTTVTLAVVAGTPGATPAYPSLPADAGNTWNVPLAFVRIANGFTGATVLGVNDVEDIAPALPLSPTNGSMTARPVQYVSLSSGSAAALLNQSTGTEKWAASGNRPGTYMPPTMMGGETLFIPFRFVTINTVPTNAITTIDTSVDWRGRLFRVEVFTSTNPNFPWDPASGNSTNGPFTSLPPAAGKSTVIFGSSAGTADGSFAAGTFTIAQMQQATLTNMAATSHVDLLVNSSGALQVNVSSTSPAVLMFVYLTASGPYINVR